MNAKRHRVDVTKMKDHLPATLPPYNFYLIKPERTPASGTLSSAKNASAERNRLLLRVCVEGIAKELGRAF